MKEKFIYCTDEKIRDKLINQGLNLLTNKVINSKQTWIFENNDILLFSNEDKSKIKFSNKLCF